MKTKNTPLVQVLLGAEGIKKAYEMTLSAKEMQIKCLSQNYKNVIGSYFDDEYCPKVLSSSINTREIILNTDEARKYAEGLDGVKNQEAFVEKNFQNESDFIVLDHAVIMISYNEASPFALYIEDEETVKSMKMQFELMWKVADK